MHVLTIMCVSSLPTNFQSSVYFSLLHHFPEACAVTYKSGTQTFVMSHVACTTQRQREAKRDHELDST